MGINKTIPNTCDVGPIDASSQSASVVDNPVPTISSSKKNLLKEEAKVKMRKEARRRKDEEQGVVVVVKIV